VHVPRRLLELPEVLRRIVDKEVLVHHVVAGKQYPYRGGKGQAAVAAVCGEPFVTAVRGHTRRQVFRIGEGMQAEAVVAHFHFPRAEREVLQAGGILLREREVFLDDTRRGVRPGYLVVRQARDAEQAAVVHDTLELPAAFQKTGDCILVLHLFGDDESPCQGVETARRAAALFRGLGQEEVAGVLQVRTLVEVPLETAAEKTEAVLADVRLIALLHEKVLLVHDAVVRQHLDRLRPGGVHRFVLGTCQREEFGQLHSVGNGDVRVLTDDAAVLHGKQRELAFQRGCFHYISHTLLF